MILFLLLVRLYRFVEIVLESLNFHAFHYLVYFGSPLSLFDLIMKAIQFNKLFYNPILMLCVHTHTHIFFISCNKLFNFFFFFFF